MNGEIDRSAAWAALLARVDLFSGLDRVTLAKVAASLDPVAFDDGEAACVQGQPGDSFYVISRGRLGVYVSAEGEETRVATMGVGTSFGEMALLTGEPRSATVRALGRAEALRLERARFVDLLRREPGIGLAISATLSRRLDHVSRRVAQDEALIARHVAEVLSRLEPAQRRRVLEAGLLEAPDDRALRALYDDEAAVVAAHLATLGSHNGETSEAVRRALRERLALEAGADSVDRIAQVMAQRLEAAGRPNDALLLLARSGRRSAFLELLGRAVRAAPLENEGQGRAAPPLDETQTLRWIEQVTDEEAAADDALAALRERWRAAHAPPAGERALAPSASPRFPRQGWRHARARPSTIVVATVVAVCVAGATGAGRTAPALGFTLLLGAATALWVTAVPDFLVTLGLVVAWIALGIATPAQAVAGYGSPSWLLVVAILGLASAISSSGLLLRAGLLLVRHMPRGLFWQAAALLLTGVLLSPLLPSSTARAGLALPLALTAAETQRLKDRGPEAALLGLAAWIGANPLLFLFINGSTACLLAWGLLPAASHARFNFATWFVASAPLAAFAGFGSLLLLFVLLRPGKLPPAATARLNLQLTLLGWPAAREVAMALILALTVVGWSIAPALGLPAVIVGLLGLLAAALAGCFDTRALKGLNWDFIVAYGVLLGIPQLTAALGLDQVAAGLVRHLAGETGLSPLVFVEAVALFSLLVRVFLPQDPALLLLAVALVPVAPVAGVDPWIVVVTLLATYAPWFFPSQTPGYLVAYEASEGRLFSHRQALLACAGYTGITLVGLALCLPYWHLLGLA